jgi:hypothetical protein
MSKTRRCRRKVLPPVGSPSPERDALPDAVPFFEVLEDIFTAQCLSVFEIEAVCHTDLSRIAAQDWPVEEFFGLDLRATRRWRPFGHNTVIPPDWPERGI